MPHPQSVHELVDARRRLPSPEDRLRIRTEAGVSREALAAELGVSPSAVYLWEMGRSTPSRRHVVDYVNVLDGLCKP